MCSSDLRAFLQRSQPGGSFYTESHTEVFHFRNGQLQRPSHRKSVDQCAFQHILRSVEAGGRVSLVFHAAVTTELEAHTPHSRHLAPHASEETCFPVDDGCRRASTTVREALAPTRKRVGWLLLPWFTRYRLSTVPGRHSDGHPKVPSANILLVVHSLPEPSAPKSSRPVRPTGTTRCRLVPSPWFRTTSTACTARRLWACCIPLPVMRFDPFQST